MMRYLIARQCDTGQTVDLEPLDETDDPVIAERIATRLAEEEFEGEPVTMVILQVMKIVEATAPPSTKADVKVRPFQ